MVDEAQDERSNGREPAYLEVPVKGRRTPRRVIIDHVPFVLGRGDHVTLTLFEEEVSTEHAEIDIGPKGYVLRDLQSTNGTFLNGARVSEARLVNNDVIHLAHFELRFRIGRPLRRARATLNVDDAEQQKLIQLASALNEVLTSGQLVPVYQPIVRLDDRSVVGFESLGRTGRATLSFGEMLKLADQRGQGDTLSQVMREIALRRLPAEPGWIFFNLHPAEFPDIAELTRSFDLIARHVHGAQRAVIEVSESSVTDLEHMARVRDAIHGRGLLLAYDDFGAGQSRLMELCTVPPDFLKLDMALVRDIDREPHRARRDLLRAVITSMREDDVKVIAEGIEREEEAAVCASLGCVYGQGYLFGYPAPVEDPAER